jgi:hypothetical protein
LKANANIKAAALNIASAQFQFSVAYEKYISTKIIAEKGLTPLFKVRRSRRREL